MPGVVTKHAPLIEDVVTLPATPYVRLSPCQLSLSRVFYSQVFARTSVYFLDWIGLDWIGLDWIGLDWIGLDWIGLDWIGLDWQNVIVCVDGWLGLWCFAMRQVVLAPSRAARTRAAGCAGESVTTSRHADVLLWCARRLCYSYS
jgi:hypothetical protein